MAGVSFGDWLKRQRGAVGLTQKQLAQQLSCSLSLIRKMEYEERHPSADIVEGLAEIFDIPIEERRAFLRYAQGDVGELISTKESELVPWKTDQEPQLTNLPTTLASFIGREKEQNEVIELISKNRIVSLVGMGGIGKTQLSLQVGQRILNNYPHGVWFSALDSLSNPDLVLPTIAHIFDIREIPNQPVITILTNVLRKKTALLILDNCEHLLYVCAQLITELLLNCPNINFLVTSREVLNVTGEAVYQLAPLSTPGQDEVLFEDLTEYEAVRLFIECAARAFPSFTLTKVNARAVTEICRKVEGIPLAIELAAAYVNFLQVEEILKQLNDSFALLTSNSRTTLARHQTLQASMDWSWELLDSSEQIFLQQLSVFAGGWTLESAQAVCDGHVINLTNLLVKKSLIVVKQKASRETRYDFHEIVRQYIREKTKEPGKELNTRNRHLKYFLQLSEQAEPALRGFAQVEWHARLNDERDNLRVALEWAEQTDVEAGLYLLGRLYRFWENFDIRESLSWLTKLIENPGSTIFPHARAKALLGQGYLLFWSQQYTQAPIDIQASLELFRACSDQQGEIDALLFKDLVSPTSQTNENKKYCEQALAMAQSLGDTWRQARALFQLSKYYNDDERFKRWEEAIILLRQSGDLGTIVVHLSTMGYYAMLNGDLDVAESKLKEAARLNEQLNDKNAMCFLLYSLGRMAVIMGDYEQAKKYYQEELNTIEKTGNLLERLWCRAHLGHLALRENNLIQAYQTLTDTLLEFHNQKREIGVVFSLEGLAGICVATNKPILAAQLIGWADATREKISDTRPLIEQRDVDKIIESSLMELGEASFSDEYEAGRKMSMDDIVAFALYED